MTITKEGIFVSDKPRPEGDCDKYGSLGDCLVDKLNQNAEQVLIIDDGSGRRWTGAQIKEKLMNVATALIDKLDFKPGTMVCVSSDDSDYACLLALGVVCAGGIVSYAHPLDPYPEMLYLARRVDFKFFFCLNNILHMVDRFQKDLGHQVVGILMDGEPDKCDPFTHVQHFLNYDHTKSKRLLDLPVTFEDTSKEPCFIMMSSGTTGKPKAVPASQKQCIQDVIWRKLTRDGETCACLGPLDYVSGRMVFLGALGSGYTAIIMKGFEPKKYLEAVQKYKINSIFVGAASLYKLITYKHIDDYDISSVKRISPAGAKMVYLDELKNFLNKHPHITQILQGYGNSESCGGAINIMTVSEYLSDHENCGTIDYGKKAKIVDPETGKLLGPNNVGLLQLWSETPFLGYYDAQLLLKESSGKENQETNTSSSSSSTSGPFVRDSSTFDEDYFYITGDLAYFNDKEEIFIIGRQKEMMSCRAAKKVLPQELEDVIEEHELVSKVCVVGIPNKRELTLHCPRAFIIIKSEYYQDDVQKRFIESRRQSSDGAKTINKLQQERDPEILEHKGNHTLCKLDTELRRFFEEDLMRFVDSRVGWEKQLTGGIAILDDVPNMRASGKMNKTLLRLLDLDQIEIYGDRSG